MDKSVLLALLLGLIVPAHALDKVNLPAAQPDCVYDYRLMSDQECRAYRAKVVSAQSDEERLQLRKALHKTLDQRAKERGIATGDWRGLAVPPLGTGATR